MDEKTLYAHILNLPVPWQVNSLSLDKNAGSVTVTVGIAEHTALSCPTCGKYCPIHDHRHRKWRHLDTCQFTTLVEADVSRINYPEHVCQNLPVPWACRGSRYTLLFELFVLSCPKISTNRYPRGGKPAVVAANLLNRQFNPWTFNTWWSGDITYF